MPLFLVLPLYCHEHLLQQHSPILASSLSILEPSSLVIIRMNLVTNRWLTCCNSYTVVVNQHMSILSATSKSCIVKVVVQFVKYFDITLALGFAHLQESVASPAMGHWSTCHSSTVQCHLWPTLLPWVRGPRGVFWDGFVCRVSRDCDVMERFRSYEGSSQGMRGRSSSIKILATPLAEINNTAVCCNMLKFVFSFPYMLSIHV